MKSFAVLGLGRFGRQLALSLAQQGAEVLAIDRVRKIVDDVADEVTRAVTANIQDKDVMTELGVAECDCVIIAFGGDLAASVVALINLKAMGVKQIICKAYDEVHKEVLMKLGADRVIIPEQEIADKLANQLVSPALRDYISLSDGYLVEEISAPGCWLDRTLADLRIRSKYRADVIAIRRGGKTLVSPGGDDQIKKDDVLVLLGATEALDDIRQLR